MTYKDFTPEQKRASDELVRRGSIRHLLTPPQRVFYDKYKNSTDDHFGFYCSRKFGKSTTLFLIACEYAMTNPKTVTRIILPQMNQAKEVYFQIYNEIKDFMPKENIPRLNRTEGKFYFLNGSYIALGGSRPEDCESNRGPLTHFLLLDEIASFHANNYNYLLLSILLPQMTTTNGKRIDACTPPYLADHPWLVKDYPKLVGKGNLSRFTVYDNPLVSSEKLMKIIEDYGGTDSPDFRREFMCEVISDKSLVLVPEFNPMKHVVSDFPKVDHFGNEVVDFWHGVGVDTATTVDFTAIVQGYYDRYRDKLVITADQQFNNKTTDEFVKILGIYQGNMVIDVMPQTAFDMRRDYGLIFRSPNKGKVEESIAFIRNCFEKDKIVIHESCKMLIGCLETAIWKEDRKDFERTPTYGHADLIMALTYLAKIVPWIRANGGKPPPIQTGGIRKSFRR